MFVQSKPSPVIRLQESDSEKIDYGDHHVIDTTKGGMFAERLETLGAYWTKTARKRMLLGLPISDSSAPLMWDLRLKACYVIVAEEYDRDAITPIVIIYRTRLGNIRVQYLGIIKTYSI
jgi:hypothetical protein